MSWAFPVFPVHTFPNCCIRPQSMTSFHLCHSMLCSIQSNLTMFQGYHLSAKKKELKSVTWSFDIWARSDIPLKFVPSCSQERFVWDERVDSAYLSAILKCLHTGQHLVGHPISGNNINIKQINISFNVLHSLHSTQLVWMIEPFDCSWFRPGDRTETLQPMPKWLLAIGQNKLYEFF